MSDTPRSSDYLPQDYVPEEPSSTPDDDAVVFVSGDGKPERVLGIYDNHDAAWDAIRADQKAGPDLSYEVVNVVDARRDGRIH